MAAQKPGLIISDVESLDKLAKYSVMGYFQAAPSRPPGDAMNLEELTMPHNDVQAMFISITFDATVNLCSPEMSNNTGGTV